MYSWCKSVTSVKTTFAKIQKKLSNTIRRTAVFKSNIRDNNITKGSIHRLHVAKLEYYRNEKDLNPTFHSTERVITDNKEKHIVIENEANIASDYVHETKIIHPHHFYNTETKLKPTIGLNENSKTSLYSSIGYDSSPAQPNNTITHADPCTIIANYDHKQTEYKYLPLQHFPESIYMRTQIKKSKNKIPSTSLQITPMIDIFDRKKDQSQIKCHVSKNASTAKLIDNKPPNNSAPNLTQNRH